MKNHIHPNYKLINVLCVCGKNYSIFSTLCRNINIDICNFCHPIITGKSKSFKIKGRLEKFNNKYRLTNN